MCHFDEATKKKLLEDVENTRLDIATIKGEVSGSEKWSKLAHDTLQDHIGNSSQWKTDVENCIKEIKCPELERINGLITKKETIRSVWADIWKGFGLLAIAVSVFLTVTRILTYLEDINKAIPK